MGTVNVAVFLRPEVLDSPSPLKPFLTFEFPKYSGKRKERDWEGLTSFCYKIIHAHIHGGSTGVAVCELL